jgi:hypothetical protein
MKGVNPMKKTFALLMALLVLLCLSAPLYALAEDSLALPDNAAPVVTAEPTEAVENEPVATEPAETDPGGIDFDVTDLLNWIIRILFSLIIYQAIPWLRTKLGERRFQNVMAAIGVAVNAAEEEFHAGNGTKKYNYVVDYLKRKHIKFDEAEIKGTVYEQINKLKEAKKPVGFT